MSLVDCNKCQNLRFDERIGEHECHAMFYATLSNSHSCNRFEQKPVKKTIINSPLTLSTKDIAKAIKNGWATGFQGNKRVLKNSKTIFIPKRILKPDGIVFINNLKLRKHEII